jgi:hypothetical protein
MKNRVLSLIVVVGAVALSAAVLVACQETPQKDAATEEKLAQEKITKAEKEAAEKTAKATRDADEKIAMAAKDLAEKKAAVKKDLAEELADIKYKAFMGLSDYRALVNTRIDEQEKRLSELKAKRDSVAGTMKADTKKELGELVTKADADLKVARTEIKILDTTTEPTWSASKGKVDDAVKAFAKSVDAVSSKIEQKA